MYQLLLIDDSSIDALLFESALQEAGQKADLTVILDSLSAVAYLREHGKNIDGVVLDLNMPGMDGFGVLQEMQAMEYHPPVIVMSTSDAQRDKSKSLELGATKYITKPLQFEELIDIAKDILPIVREP